MFRSAPRSAVASATIFLLAACAGPSESASRAGPQGPAMRVVIGDGERVWLQGDEMTFERMLYEIRVAVREAGGDAERLPWLDVRTPAESGALALQRLNRLRDEAYVCGVRHVELSMADR